MLLVLPFIAHELATEVEFFQFFNNYPHQFCNLRPWISFTALQLSTFPLVPSGFFFHFLVSQLLNSLPSFQFSISPASSSIFTFFSFNSLKLAPVTCLLNFLKHTVSLITSRSFLLQLLIFFSLSNIT